MKIYIVLTHTRTILSKIIRKFTGDEFSHVSIALDIELEKMYSFGRLNPYNPFIGGFVNEHINKGTFKRFYKTKAKIFSLDVTSEQYLAIKNTIDKFDMEKSKYKFNIIGMIAAGVHKKIGNDHAFYCAEFVKYVLEEANIKTNLPEIVKPEDFKSIPDLEEIYSGLLKKYRVPIGDIRELIRENLLIYQKKKESIV